MRYLYIFMIIINTSIYANIPILTCQENFTQLWNRSTKNDDLEAVKKTINYCKYNQYNGEKYQLLEAKIYFIENDLNKSISILNKIKSQVTLNYYKDINNTLNKFLYLYMLGVSGYMNYELQNWQITIDDMNKYLEVNYDNGCMIYLACAYSEVGMYEKSLNSFTIAYRKNQSALNAFYLASIYAEMGQVKESLHWLQITLSMDKKLKKDIKIEINFDKMRNNKRYIELMKKY